MMDEQPFDDADTEARKMACCIVENIADRAAQAGLWIMTDTASFIASAAEVAHFISAGEGVSVDCNEGSRKFVRGGV